jgi:hypothetical protein
VPRAHDLPHFIVTRSLSLSGGLNLGTSLKASESAFLDIWGRAISRALFRISELVHVHRMESSVVSKEFCTSLVHTVRQFTILIAHHVTGHVLKVELVLRAHKDKVWWFVALWWSSNSLMPW